MKKIVILSNHHMYTYNFRKEIIQRLIEENYKVYIVLPYGEKVELLKEMGCEFMELPLDRRGLNPIKDLQLFISYLKIFKKIKPDAVLSYTIKPNIYGGIACRIKKIPFFPNITGLGSAVKSESFVQKIILKLYKTALKKASCVFFQNEDNKNYLIKNSININNYQVLPGSGINLTSFKYLDYPEENKTIKFLFIGRIMKDKGIEELIAAAEIIKKQYSNIEIDAIGFVEDDYKQRVNELKEMNIINFIGQTDDVINYIKKSNAVVLPSHHEGMANVLLEAAASGRPILASRIPGCQETFEDEITGIGFEVQNTNSLVAALIKFIELDYDKKMKMGIAGRKKMVKEFDRENVVKAYLEEINTLFYKGEEENYEFISTN